MGAPPGNKFWQARSSHGRKPTFSDPDELWSACVEYFEWNHKNKLKAVELVKFEGRATRKSVPKMRAMTIKALCFFLDVTEQSWRSWRTTQPHLVPAMDRAEAVIYEQKFTGAAAGLLSHSIITRELGLADSVKVAGHDGGALVTFDPSKLPTEALEALLNARQPDPDEG